MKKEQTKSMAMETNTGHTKLEKYSLFAISMTHYSHGPAVPSLLKLPGKLF